MCAAEIMINFFKSSGQCSKIGFLSRDQESPCRVRVIDCSSLSNSSVKDAVAAIEGIRDMIS